MIIFSPDCSGILLQCFFALEKIERKAGIMFADSPCVCASEKLASLSDNFV